MLNYADFAGEGHCNVCPDCLMDMRVWADILSLCPDVCAVLSITLNTSCIGPGEIEGPLISQYPVDLDASGGLVLGQHVFCVY